MPIEHLKRAAKAAGAGDAREAILALLDAWRELPAPAIAEAIEALTDKALPDDPPAFDDAAEQGDALESGRLVARLCEGGAAEAAGRAGKLRLDRDPRVSAAALDFIEHPPYHATSSQPFWTRLFGLFMTSADPRALPRLKAIKYEKIIKGGAMRRWMEKKVAAAAAKLEPAPRLPADVKAALAKVKLGKLSAQATPRPARKSGPSERDLFQAVYEAPDDDAPRAVLADFLTERGDPRGELITLQLADDRAHDKRVLQLIRKHQKGWLGALAPFVKYLAYPHVEPDDRAGIYMWWRRGFMTGCVSNFTRPKLIELGTSPLWSTVERLSNLQASDDGKEDEPTLAMLGALRALRSLDGTNLRTLGLAARVPQVAGRLDSLRMSTPEGGQPQVLRLLARFPRLRRLVLRLWHQEDPDAALLGELQPWKTLDTLVIEASVVSFALVRAGAGRRLLIKQAQPGAEKTLALLPAGEIAEISFDGVPKPRQDELAARFPSAKVTPAA